jgi:hypothetical protein
MPKVIAPEGDHCYSSLSCEPGDAMNMMIVYAACLTALTLAGMAGAAAMWAIRAGHIPRTFAAVALTGAGLILALESSSLSGQTLKSVFAIYFALLAVAYGALWLLLRTIRFSATATGLPPLTPGIEPPAIPVIPTADTAASVTGLPIR